MGSYPGSSGAVFSIIFLFLSLSCASLKLFPHGGATLLFFTLKEMRSCAAYGAQNWPKVSFPDSQLISLDFSLIRPLKIDKDASVSVLESFR